jgi:hypothetical protein
MLSNVRKEELRQGLRAMVDLAWRSGEYSAPRGTDWEPVEDLKAEEVEYVKGRVQVLLSKI